MLCTSTTLKTLPQLVKQNGCTKYKKYPVNKMTSTQGIHVMGKNRISNCIPKKICKLNSPRVPFQLHFGRSMALQGGSVEASSVSTNSAENVGKELLIVGPGVLGSLVGIMWLENNTDARVMGQTNTDTKHKELKDLGIIPRLKCDADGETFSNVIFCAPPSGSEDYLAEIAAAVKLWNGTGVLMFTSSTAVYTEDPAILYTEDSPQVDREQNPRAARLMDAEELVMAAGGCAVRLAGLYHAQRGAHMYYLKAKEVPVRPDGLLNLIHYQDAASLCVAVMSSGLKSRVFLGCDNNPVSKEDMMDACYASGKFGDDKVVFTSTVGSTGRSMNDDATRSAVNWKPTYDSFQLFMKEYSEDNVIF